jgi:hypothetical protein
MTCEICGNSAARSSHSCPQCKGGGFGISFEDAERSKNIGYKFGHDTVSGIGGLLGAPWLSYFWFWLIWVVATFYVGRKLGLVSDDVESTPFWYLSAMIFLPIVLAVVFRRQIRAYLPTVLQSIFYLGGLLLILGFFVLLVRGCVGG